MLTKGWREPLFFCVLGKVLNKFTKSEVEKKIEEAAVLCKLSIYDFSVVFRNAQTTVSVKIDNGATVGLNDCETYSRKLEELLETVDIKEKYTIEVSSPGLKRELRNYDEYVRFVGSPVKLLVNGLGTVKGVLEKCEDSVLFIKTQKELIEVKLDDIKKTNLDY